MDKKTRIIRVVTASYVVPWHLKNTLKRIASDYEVFVVGYDVNKNKKIYPGIKFYDIPINRKTNIFFDLFALYELIIFILKYKPTIIHSIMPKAGFLSALAGLVCRVPVRIHTFTGQTWASKKGFSRFIYYFIDKMVNSFNTVCLTDSYSQSDYLFKNNISYKGKPLPILGKGSLSGVDVDRFNKLALSESSEKLRENLGISGSDFIFSYIARKTVDKGALDILEAFSRVTNECKNTKLFFIGPYEDELIRDLLEKKPYLYKNVIDIGFVSNHEQYLSISDVLVLPSYREGFGSIVIDAAAMGVPAIGSFIPGLVDSIDDMQTGLLFKVGDIEELVSKMQMLINNPLLLEKLSYNAKIRINKYFTADLMYAALKEFYIKYEHDYQNRQRKI